MIHPSSLIRLSALATVALLVRAIVREASAERAAPRLLTAMGGEKHRLTKPRKGASRRPVDVDDADEVPEKTPEPE